MESRSYLGGVPLYNRNTFPYASVRWVDEKGRKYLFHEDWDSPEWCSAMEQRGELPVHVALPHSIIGFPQSDSTVTLKLDGRDDSLRMAENVRRDIIREIQLSVKTGDVAVRERYIKSLLPPQPLSHVRIVIHDIAVVPPSAKHELIMEQGPKSKRPRTASYESSIIGLCTVTLAPEFMGISTLTHLLTPSKLVEYIDPGRIQDTLNITNRPRSITTTKTPEPSPNVLPPEPPSPAPNTRPSRTSNVQYTIKETKKR